MLYRFLSFSLIIFFCFTQSAKGQLIVNELSQGTNGTKEYVELVVVGNRSCNGDSCLDIRGWIIDDNNGWFGAGSGQGIAQGHIRFALHSNWSCVPYGSIIVIYNSGDKNTSITLPDDPTDANNDNVYIVPSTSALLEHTTATPVSPSSLTYSYSPATVYNASGDWSTIGLANGGDAITVVNPVNPGVAVHSLAYGSVSNGTNATIYFTQSGGATNYYLTNGNFTTTAAYSVGVAPTNESPGAPNTTANATWINGMLSVVGGVVHDTIAACIVAGSSYPFNGSNISVAGMYTDTFTTPLGCDSIVHLDLAVTQPLSTFLFLEGCSNVTHNGIVYTSSITISDTLSNTMGCDSAYVQTFIHVFNVTPQVVFDSVSGCQNVIYDQKTYWQDTIVTDTLVAVSGCDSVYRKAVITVLPTPQIQVPEHVTICNGASTTLTAVADYPVTWRGFPEGQNPIVIAPTTETEYVVTTKDSLNCVGISWTTVSIDDFKVQLSSSKDSIEIQEWVKFTATGSDIFSVSKWLPENVFGNTNKEQQIRYANDGTKQVGVIGISEHGCVDTAYAVVEVLANPVIFIPNAFSPNNDGLNDFFKPEENRQFILTNFSVFNRYGERVYYAGNTRNVSGWDGSYKEKPCDVGVYFYMITAVNPRSGEEVHYKGDVTLVR